MVFLASRRVKKEDMRRIAKSTGASIVTTLADMEGNETFDPSVLGEADEVSGRDIQRCNPCGGPFDSLDYSVANETMLTLALSTVYEQRGRPGVRVV